jgi:DNA-directed RNA polymerase subunit RPC12/RpoP
MYIIVIIISACILGWLILYLQEGIQLLCWKKRKCPNCSQKFNFKEKDLGEWSNNNIKHENIDNIEYQGVLCPHCHRLVFKKEAPSFDKKII